MPRRKAPPRLYLDPRRQQWVIRDGTLFLRTGRDQGQRESAEKLLAKYIGKKYEPQASSNPLVAEVLAAYASEHLPHTRAAANASYQIDALTTWWGPKRISQMTAKECRAYAGTKSPAAARRDLETLRAAINYWHREYGPIADRPAVVLPPKAPPRQRWLNRKEAAALLRTGRRTQHLRRFILLGLYTGSRSGVILGLKWNQIDLEAGVLYRTPLRGRTSDKKRAPPVRLGKRILAHLRRWQRMDKPHLGYLCHYNGARVIKMRRSWAAARKAAKLDKSVTPHTLRHTRATWLMQRGVDIWEAAGSLGMSVEMLERNYGHHHPSFQKEAADV